jgi:MOSC domain-containing protein YiiM
MTTLRCADCGFDETRWSVSDIERTVAHTADLIGYALEGADASVVASARGDSVILAESDERSVTTAHRVMHRLHELAAARRAAESFEPMTGRVASLQASSGGVPKTTIASAEIGSSGMSVDVQGNRAHHGRPWQAICLYSSDRIAELVAEGHPISPGSTGENLTVAGVDWSRLRGGLTITIGDVVLFTSSPAAPCHKIGDSFVDRKWTRIAHEERPGWARWYASVLVGGTIHPGDTITVTA